MKNIKISIIVPAYNVGQWLSRCVNSILSQTHQNLEVILIDDGSTDNTLEIIREFEKKDSRIIGIHQENSGLVEVREKGILASTGEYVAFVDGDDAVEKDMYQRLLENAIKYNADISHCGLKVVYSDGTTELHYGTEQVSEYDRVEGIQALLAGESFDPSLCNKLYKRSLLCNSCLDKAVLNNEDLLRNYTLFRRAKKSVYQDFCGYQYYSRVNSMSNDDKILYRIQSVLRARKLILENSDSSDEEAALKLWLSTNVNVINELRNSESKEAVKISEDCRIVLRQNKKNIKLLIKRQQIAAYLIILSLKVYRKIYGIYSRL